MELQAGKVRIHLPAGNSTNNANHPSAAGLGAHLSELPTVAIVESEQDSGKHTYSENRNVNRNTRVRARMLFRIARTPEQKSAFPARCGPVHAGNFSSEFRTRRTASQSSASTRNALAT